MKRKRTKTMPPQLSSCAVAGCSQTPEPIMCATHWSFVSPASRRAVAREFKAAVAKKAAMTPKFLRALTEAAREAGR